VIDYFRYWKNYLLLFCTVFYTIGIGCHSLFLFTPSTVQLIFLVSTVLFFFLRYRSRVNFSLWILFFVFFLFGIYQGDRHAIKRLGYNHIAAQVLEPEQAVLIGTLSKMVTTRQGFSKATMDVAYLRTKRSPDYQKAEGRISLNLMGAWPESILPGHSFIVHADVQAPSVTNVPGTFNYRKFLARKNIYLVGLVRSPTLIQPVEQLSHFKLTHLRYHIERLRFHIGKRIDANLSEPRGPLYRALLIGDRSQIDDEVYETLKRAGVLHILAISGMHLGLLAALAFGAIYWLMRRSERLMLNCDVRKYALFLTLPLLLLYAFLAGFQPPVVRSLIMVSCLVFSYGLHRLHSPLTTLSCAALLILLFDPSALESAGFQLSFAAVSSIILLAQPLQSLLIHSLRISNDIGAKLLKLFFTLLSVTLAASIGTLPLMLVHFNRLSIVAIAANIAIEPIICLFSLPLGFCSVLLMPFSPSLAKLALDLGAHGIDLSIKVSSYLSGPDFTQIWLPAPGLFLCFLYFLSIFIVLCSFHSIKWLFLGIGGFATALISFYLPHNPISANKHASARITILDVGHGSSNVIELSNGRIILIDGGSKKWPGYDCGERLIAPYLWSRKIRRIDDVVLTHDDADHYNGIGTVIRRFKPDRLWIPADESPKKGFARLVDYARSSGVEIVFPEPGVMVDEGNEVISILGSYLEPPKNQNGGDRYSSSGDDNGLVVKLRAFNTTILFPGDITKMREQRMVDISENLGADVLLSPHHGSSTSNSEEFLEAVTPDIIIFSNGENKNGLFPANETVKRVDLLGIDSLETAAAGTITISVETKEQSSPPYRISTFNIAPRKYWVNS